MRDDSFCHIAYIHVPVIGRCVMSFKNLFDVVNFWRCDAESLELGLWLAFWFGSSPFMITVAYYVIYSFQVYSVFIIYFSSLMYGNIVCDN
jgi:hypothetical protein